MLRQAVLSYTFDHHALTVVERIVIDHHPVMSISRMISEVLSFTCECLFQIRKNFLCDSLFGHSVKVRRKDMIFESTRIEIIEYLSQFLSVPQRLPHFGVWRKFARPDFDIALIFFVLLLHLGIGRRIRTTVLKRIRENHVSANVILHGEFRASINSYRLASDMNARIAYVGKFLERDFRDFGFIVNCVNRVSCCRPGNRIWMVVKPPILLFIPQ